MRALAILLLSGSFVIAGDDSPLEHAVQKFKSRSPEERNAAQRVVDRELRRMLAPLLEAMKDADPEVRLRARKSLLALIPNPPVQEKQQPAPVNNVNNNAFVPANARRFTVTVWGEIRKQEPRTEAARRLQKDADKKATRFLSSFGLTGRAGFLMRIAEGERVNGFMVHRAKKTAAAFGLKRGDLIRKVNGLTIANADNLRIAFGDKPEKATIEVLRGRKLLTLTTKPAARR